MAEVMKHYANTHSQFAKHAMLTSKCYAQARKNLKSYLGLDETFVLLPCGTGATAAIKKFQELMGIYVPPATITRLGDCIEEVVKPLVVIGPFEHHSNELGFREGLCDLERIPLDESGNVDLAYLRDVLRRNSDREIIGSFSVASNVTGIVSPYEEISRILREYGAVVAFDAAASSPCLDVDSSLYDVMYLSPHKLLGGPGSCGLLAIKKRLINEEEAPTFAGGGTVVYVSPWEQTYNDIIETREDAGTPGILQMIKAALAYQLRDEIGIEKISKLKSERYRQLKDALSDIEGIKIYSDIAHDCIGILAINIDGMNPYRLCESLSDKYGLQTRPGCSCAGPYAHDLFGISKEDKYFRIPSWLRISVNFMHSQQDIEYLVSAIKNLIDK